MDGVNNGGEEPVIQQRVLDLVNAGAPVSLAVQIALAPSREREDVRTAIPKFAERHGLNPKATARGIYGGVHLSAELLDALCIELGGTPEQWRELLRYGDRLGVQALAG